MIEYNTQASPLILPEYGRNIQKMVDFCVTIEDREERTRCACAIIKIMKTLFPDQSPQAAREQKLWDHLYKMSGFRLDIDFPVEVLKEDEMNPVPDSIPCGENQIRWRHYGRNIELMIDKVAALEDGPDKDALISMIAHHMKKLLLIHNKEGVDDAKILRDLATYSNGRIVLDPETYLLHEFKEAPTQPQQGKKSRKKRK